MIADQRDSPLRFATFLAPNMLPVYRFLADRIGERLGRRVELVVGRSFDQFERGEADLGVICGLPYVRLADRRPPPVEPLAAPVLAGARYGGRPVYYSDVIVSRASPISCLEELEGCSWAYNEPASHSGHTVTLHGLVRLGARPGFFARVVEAGFHQRAIRLVHAGAVDAAAIDSQVLAIELRDHPGLAAGLRVAGCFGPSTIQPVVAANHLPDRLKTQVRELLVGLGEDPTARPLLAHGLIDRFTPVGDAAYDDIRAMLATIEAAGWTSLTQTMPNPDTAPDSRAKRPPPTA
jgi:phosphonate transport system substrate-binding protein